MYYQALCFSYDDRLGAEKTEKVQNYPLSLVFSGNLS